MKTEKKKILKQKGISMEENDSIRCIKPMSEINYTKIIDEWQGEWDENISNCLNPWKLVAYPIMPNGTALLIFELEEHVTGDDPHALFSYRILLYDMTMEPKLLKKAQVQLQDEQLQVAFFIKDELYIVKGNEEGRYILCHARPYGNPEECSLGEAISDYAITKNGNIMVGYSCWDDSGDRCTPVVTFVRDGENKYLRLPSAVGCKCLATDANGNVWAHVAPKNTILKFNEDSFEEYFAEIAGYDAFGFSEDGKKLLVSYVMEHRSSRNYELTWDEEMNMYKDPREVVLDTGEEEKDLITFSASVSGSRALFAKAGKLYMVNLNELSWDEKELAKEGEAFKKTDTHRKERRRRKKDGDK